MLQELLEATEKLRAEIRAQHAERESYVLMRDKAYVEMRKELELQMELYEGKAIELLNGKLYREGRVGDDE